jgi:cytoskeleton protein RodZ
MSEIENLPGAADQTGINPKHLSALRESKGLTVSDISQRTRLSSKQVDLLESGQYSALPGSAFVMGALRSYCKVVGIEPERYLEDAKTTFAASLDQDLPTPDRLQTSLPSRAAGGLENSSSRLWWVASGLLGVIAIGLYFANPNGLAGLIKKDVGKVTAQTAASAIVTGASPGVSQPAQVPSASSVPVPVPAATDATSGSSTTQSTTTQSMAEPASTQNSTNSATSNQPTSTLSIAAPVPALASTTAGGTSAVSPVPVSTSGSQSIELNLSRDAWVEVKELGGKSLVNRLFKAGSKESIPIPGPVNVVVGSASGVSLNWSGSPLDLKPYTRDDVARFTLK